jgi:hypothetical protein
MAAANPVIGLEIAKFRLITIAYIARGIPRRNCC